MKTITDLKEANTLLKLYSGASIQVYLFSISLKRLMLRLILPNNKTVVYLVCIGCESITGKFNWEGANLYIVVESTKENDQHLTRIIDEKAGFELVTSGGFSMAMGYEKEFGASFDNFIKK